MTRWRGKASCRKTRSVTVSGCSLFLVAVTTWPVTEKSLSTGTLVTVIVRYLRDTWGKYGNRILRCQRVKEKKKPKIRFSISVVPTEPYRLPRTTSVETELVPRPNPTQFSVYYRFLENKKKSLIFHSTGAINDEVFHHTDTHISLLFFLFIINNKNNNKNKQPG